MAQLKSLGFITVKCAILQCMMLFTQVSLYACVMHLTHYLPLATQYPVIIYSYLLLMFSLTNLLCSWYAPRKLLLLLRGCWCP